MAFRDDLSAPAPSGVARDAAGFARPGVARPTADAGPAVIAPPTTAAPADAAPPRSRRRTVLLAALVLALAIGGYVGFGWFTTGRFMISTDDAYVQADVTVLAAKASGYVTAIEVADNQSVEAGQVIARIDDVDYRLAVQAAADRVATQNATVERIAFQIEAAEAQVAQAEPQIAAARAEGVRAAAEYERQERLSQADFASKARFEQSRADRDRAQASIKSAEAGLLAARANVAVLRAQRAEAERSAAELRTAAQRAERDLWFTVVRAPVAGIVGNRAMYIGSYVQPGTRLAALVPLATVHVDANFKETQLGQIRPGQRAHIEVDAFPGRDFPATVESIAPASGSQFSLLPPENATGNFTKIVQRVPVRLKVEAGPDGGLLRPGLSVVVRVDSRDRSEPAR